jgi:hypothetical protein
MTLKYDQVRQVSEIQPYQTQAFKQVYWTSEERVKFYFF